MSTDATTPGSTLKRTPLFDQHRELGARLVEFSGWAMPVQYSGVIEEHRAVRERAGLFDVSHMGEFTCVGAGALDFLQSMVPNDVAKLAKDQALYTQLCHPDGGVVDDLLIYQTGEQEYMLVVNAGTMEKDWVWLIEHADGRDGVTLTNISNRTGLIALQGPRAATILQPLTATPLDEIAYYHSRTGAVAGIPCRISRTGYTGEDGFELYSAWEVTPDVWNAVLSAGAPYGLLPAGLGARDTLRLEAGYCLYGHELTDEITPLEAGLGWTVKLNKGADFIGREALLAQKTNGLRRKLVGVKLLDRGVPREGYPILRAGERIGALTSGTMLPTAGIAAGMGYVAPAEAQPDAEIAVEIRGKAVPATFAALPFYKRGR